MKRTLIRALTVAGASLGAVEILAWLRMHREEAEHSAAFLHVEEYGSGDPVLFVPGLQATTRYWGDVRPLARGRRLLLTDLLGFGRSPWPMKSAYTLADHIEWLHKTMAARDATHDLTIVAHSFGTIVAAHYAATYSSEVRRLILLGAPVFGSVAEARERIRGMSSIAALFSLNRVFAREGCMVVCAFRPLMERIAPLARPDLPREIASDAMLHHWPSIRGAIEILLNVPIESALEKIGSKTVLVHGTEDTVTSLERIHALATSVGAQVIEVPGAAHHGYRPALPGILGG